MYGDTHVAPAILCEITTEPPPPDAIEIYFAAPMSLSLLADLFCSDEGLAHMDRELAEIVLHATNKAVTVVQQVGGYVIDADLGRSVPARLELAARVENDVPGQSVARLHTHLYVGRTATSLEGGRRWPVDLAELRDAADMAWSTWKRLLVSETTSVFGYRWAPLPGHHPADVELVEPPLHEHVHLHARVFCPGLDTSGHERIVADEQSRRITRQMGYAVDAGELPEAAAG